MLPIYPIHADSINTKVFYLCIEGKDLIIPDIMNAADFQNHSRKLTQHEGEPKFELRSMEYALTLIEHASQNIYLLEVVPNLSNDIIYFECGHHDGVSNFSTDEGILVDSVKVTGIFDFNSMDDLKRFENHELLKCTGFISNNQESMADWIIKNDVVELSHWLKDKSQDMLLHSLILHSSVKLTLQMFDDGIINEEAFVEQLGEWRDYGFEKQYAPVLLHVASRVKNLLRSQVLDFVFHKGMLDTAHEIIKIGCTIDNNVPAFFLQLTNQKSEGLTSFINAVIFDKQTITWWTKAACVTRDAQLLDMSEAKINLDLKEVYHSTLIRFAKACDWDEIFTRYTKSELKDVKINLEQAACNSLTDNCVQGNWYACQLLLKQGADVTVNANEPIRAAVKNGYLGIVKLLYKFGADLHAWGNEPIKLANEHEHVAIKHFLLEQGIEDKFFDRW